MPVNWFRRMGDIPGLDYEPLVPVERTALARHDVVPQLHRYEIDGRVRESLWWDAEDGQGSSASPAHEIAFGGLDAELATSTLLKRLSEALELPGEPSDYHFAIQGVAASFWTWKRRAREPDVVEWAERLSWLDRLWRASTCIGGRRYVQPNNYRPGESTLGRWNRILTGVLWR